jgi:hypothetical protein
MATATASRPVHVSTPVLVTLVALIGIGGGLLLGYALGTGAGTASAGPSTVAADNTLVDDMLTTFETGTRADVEALLLPTFRYETTSGEGSRNGAGMWAMLEAWRTSMVRGVRTSDVTRNGDVLFWGGRFEATDGTVVGTDFTWTVRVTPDGRIVSIQETPR